MTPKLDDQLRSEEKQAGEEADRVDATRTLIIMFIVLLLITLCVVLVKSFARMNGVPL